jgi:hypothetical protein
LPAGVGVGQDPKDLAAKAFLREDKVKLAGTRREADGATLVRGRVTEDADRKDADRRSGGPRPGTSPRGG